MIATTRTLLCAGGALLTIAGAPAIASAQLQLAPVHVTAASTLKADMLHAQAEALPSEVRYWTQAAKLHERSAALRSGGDPMSASCLRTAAFLRYYSGERHAGAELMEQAAARSSEMGDVLLAATAYLDAAAIATELRQGDKSRELRRHAELLSASPLIGDAQRESIQARLAQWHQVAALERP